MGLMQQVTWQLMNLFIIAVAVLVLGSSGFSGSLALDSLSLIPSTEAEVPKSIIERGPLQNGPTVQPPIVSSPIKSPPVHQVIQGPPPFLSQRQSSTFPPQHDLATFIPTQIPHGSAPLLSAEPPNYSAFPAAKSPQDSTLPPVAELPHDLAPALPAAEPPPSSTPTPTMTPAVSPAVKLPLASAVPPLAKTPMVIPQVPIAEPPEALPLASPTPPPEVSQHNSTLQSPPIPPIPVAETPVISTPPIVIVPSHVASQPLNAKPPHSSALPLAANPPDSEPPLPVADTPHSSVVPPVAKPPMVVPQLPTAEPPETLPLASPSPPPKVSQHTSAMPTPIAEAPVDSSPPTVLAPLHASPQLPPVAKPPHSSALPLAANPPDSGPPLPVAETPHVSVVPSVAKPPIPQLPTAEPPETLPLASPSPPPEVSQYNSTQSPPIPPIPVAEAPLISTPPTVLVPSHASPQPLNTAKPPHSSTLPLAAKPPDPMPPLPVAEPPQGLNLTPPTEAAPVLPLVPPAMPPHSSDMQSPPVLLNASSPQPQPVPPGLSSTPPQPGPPYTLSPPPQLVLPHSPPPTSIVPSNASLLPPLMAPPSPEPPTDFPSPSPPLSPHVLSPPPQLVPPVLSSPPPQQISPIISSPPPQLNQPIVSSPPPQLIPPPAAPPTSVLPSNASSAPPPLPLVMPPPDLPLPLPSPAVPPHASAMPSPPMPSHAKSPLPQLAPPHSSSPPYVSSAPPPLELPHVSPPRSSIVPGAVPPLASPPSTFLTPPLAPAPPAIPTHPLYAPPPVEPSYFTAPPPPVRQITVPAAPPHSSQRKETQEGAPLPSLTPPEQSPSTRTLPEGAPPAHQVTPESLPPSSHQGEAPKHAPFLRSNVPEPDTSPSSAPPHRSNNPFSDRYPSMAPPGRAPDQSPGDKFLPHHGSPTAMAPLPSPPWVPEITPAPSPLQKAPPDHSGIPFLSPKISPSGSSTRKTKKPLAPPIPWLPPPPPNADCAYLTCPEPFTNTPPGSPCGCVWPMQVGLRLSVALYTFFPLVSELAREIAIGAFMKQSQVRVMGANAASQDSEKTIVLVDLVPLDEKFDNITAFLTFQRFWHKQVVIDKSLFGDYDVLYVRYPGLPASPPLAPADIAVINGMPYSVGDPDQSKMHPLGVDVTKPRHKHRLSGIVIAAIVISAIVCVLICCSVAWVLVFRHTNHDPQPASTPRALPSLARLSGPTGNSTGSGPSSSLSIGSSLANYTGSAKTFSASEIEKATDNFSPSRIVGEGGFGLVYSGVLEDETSVAVKVLKRDDQQGGREFLAEVEMLSRLHHRNLVKLIGICTDERFRCLVYELIPNGSVDSHLHGTDRENAPLDWASRMKIALGAARGLAYLHEDSSPRVIHRDFKSSNILLENDFTPKVSDFGLARSAMDEENQHISTRVMGTFGYVAPEYAMTGHLLVKSDVYSYGVVLLELLTGRKPVDMSQPPGQENLVAWTRPFLTTKESLELILDPSLGSDVPLDSVAKVAAIASMCVQPEVSHRPFMGEVVQALKLVCDECDDSKDGNSRRGSHENLSADFDDKASSISETRDYLPTQFSLQNHHSTLDVEKGMSVSENFSASARAIRQTSDSFRRYSASGPLKTVRGHFWQRMKLSNGSASEHGIMYRLWAGSH